MTASRPRARRSLLNVAWWGSALLSAFALAGLLVTAGAPGPGQPALRAATNNYNQMTGVGSTDSAVAVNWTSGLLDSSNQPITSATASTDGGPELNPNSDRTAGSGPLAFMDSDFKNLSVTVSQTQNIGQQGLTVSWAGANPTGVANTSHLDNFLQMMECYGDSDSGPSPEDCLYGSDAKQAPQVLSETPYLRSGALCGTDTLGGVQPSTTNPPDFGVPCDPFEPAAATPAHCDPTAGDPSCAANTFRYDIPFVPANDSANPVYADTLFAQTFGTTNEVPFAVTNPDGTGQRQFETFTANQAPELGCGAAESNGQTRNCWLVIVPRGSFEPSGLNVSGTSSVLSTSPLSAGNWAQRIQIHLGYAPLAANCPPTSLPQLMVGTQVAFRAVTSWQQELNQQAKCATVYSYTATTESENTSQLTGAATGIPGTAGLAFTTVPIGSEAARDGEPAPALPRILYAPVAITALDFGFNINQSFGQVTTAVNLTPALLARSLTQAYKSDLPDSGVEPSEQPAGQTWWAQANPSSIWSDPEYQKLNPQALVSVKSQSPNVPLFTGDRSGDNQLVWQYIQSDPTTAQWLNGSLTGSQADPSDPVNADPFYTSLSPQLGSSPAPDSFPVAYTPTLLCSQSVERGDCGSKASTPLDSVDMVAVQNDFDQAAATVLAANDPELGPSWNSQGDAPDGTSGWWGVTGPEPQGQVAMWTDNDMPDLAAYGLVSGALCDASGTNCLQPSVANVSAALSLATTDRATGMEEVNPATVEAADASSAPAGAYPLVDVVYAAVPTSQPATALDDYANFIKFAANQGQTAGTAQGDLPAGYLPLPASLQAQANKVVSQLQAAAGSSPTPGDHTTAPAGGNANRAALTSAPAVPAPPGAAAGQAGAGGAPAGAKNALPASGGKPTAPAAQPPATSTVPFDVIRPTAQAAAGTTPLSAVGGIRGVLFIVLIIGAAGAVVGGLLRYGKIPERFRRFKFRPDSS